LTHTDSSAYRAAAMSRSFDLQGHRGARGLFPENTLEGFAATLAVGIDTIELDVATTADGIVVVSHDPALNPDLTRGPDGRWLAGPRPAIRSLTLAELRRYDVGRLRPGSDYARQFPEQQPRDGARIPTLAEVFSLTVPAGVRVSAEVKVPAGQPELAIPLAEALLEVAHAAGAMRLLDVRSFDWQPLRHLRRRHPEVPLTWLTRPATLAAGEAPAAVAAACAAAQWTPVWAPEHTQVRPALLEEAHARGLAVAPWTVNAPEDMARLIAWGVDGLCTDRPDLARAAMRAAGLAPPRAVSS
jgi:glycerophosphoryl diester phosphodiesterase